MTLLITVLRAWGRLPEALRRTISWDRKIHCCEWCSSCLVLKLVKVKCNDNFCGLRLLWNFICKIWLCYIYIVNTKLLTFLTMKISSPTVCVCVYVNGGWSCDSLSAFLSVCSFSLSSAREPRMLLSWESTCLEAHSLWSEFVSSLHFLLVS